MKKLILALVLGITLIVLGTGVLPLANGHAAALASTVAAASDGAKGDVCNGIGLTSTGGGCGDSGAALNNAIKVAINLLSFFVGVAAIVMVIVAGLKFITAGGDTNKITSARNSIIYAIVGLVITAMSQVIVHFVLTNAKI